MEARESDSVLPGDLKSVPVRGLTAPGYSVPLASLGYLHTHENTHMQTHSPTHNLK